MRKIIILTLSFVFIVIGILKAQENQSNRNSPDIKFKSTTHDYGTMIQGADGNCEFKFSNTGKEPLILSNVVASCGCTIPTWSREPIMPGKDGIIKVHYDTNRLGLISKTITVMSNAKTDRVILQILGQINPKKTEETSEKK